MAHGDVNNDGYADLLVAGHEVNCGPSHCPQPDNPRVRVLLGAGDGVFAVGANYQGFESPGDITVGDFSGDGKLDFAVVDVFDGDHYSAHKVVVQRGNGDGTFQEPSYYYMGKPSVSVEAGDIDGDSDLDLVAVQIFSSFNILKNQGNGNFVVSAGIGTDSDARTVLVGHFTQDSAADLAVVHGAPGTVRLIPGTGNGAFVALPPSFGIGKDPSGIAMADFNADGDPDILAANAAAVYSSDGVMSVAFGGAGATIDPETTYKSGFETRSVTAADFNGDGLLDIAGGNTDAGPSYNFLSRVTVIPGTGGGAFQQVPSFSAGSANTFQMPAGDLDADGDLDLVLYDGGYNGKVIALFGTGNAGFTAPVTVIQGPYKPFFRSLTLRDLNADGKLDIAVGAIIVGQRDVVGVALGRGDDSFLPLVQYEVSNGPLGIIAHDFNNDGKLDLVSANTYSVDVSLLLGNGDGTFAAAQQFTVGPDPRYLAAGDFNNDGNPDLATGNHNGASTISILLANGDGTFQPYIGLGPSTYIDDLEVGDFNGDGNLDLLAGPYPSLPTGAELFLGNGDGTFQSGVGISTGTTGGDLTLADYNADGKLDFVLTYGYGLCVVLGMGNGSFHPAQHYTPGTDIYLTTAGDFDGDGMLDLATYTDRGDVLLVRGLADARFDVPLGLISGTGTSDIQAADVNNDGAPDLIAVNTDDKTAVVWLNQGDGFFNQPTTYATGNKPLAVAVGDFNLDGDLDFAVANTLGNSTTVYLGNGDGTFSVGMTISTGGSPQDLTAADLDGDGNPDLATANLNGTVGVFIGRGDGTFMPVQLHSAGPQPSALVSGDFNNDGFLDLAVSDASARVAVLLNDGSAAFPFAIDYVISDRGYGIVAADLDGDGWLDLAVVADGPGNFGLLAILRNAADWPPLPIGGGPESVVRLDAPNVTPSFRSPRTKGQTAVGDGVTHVNESDTAMSPRPKYSSRHIARATLAEPTHSIVDLCSTDLT